MINMEWAKKVYRIFRYIILGRKLSGINAKNHVLPNFIIIGAMKSGTTSLYNYICDHPCILPAAYDEIGFFDSNFHLGFNWYRSMFPRKKQMEELEKKKGISITGEDTPFYFWNEEAANRIKKYLPKVKLIVILRNPVDRAFSEFNNIKRDKKLDVDFETYFKEEIHELENSPRDISKFSERASIISRGIYVTQLEMWYEIFSKEQILILDTNDLMNKPDLIEKSVCKFLNLPEFYSKKVFYEKKRSYEKMNSETRDRLIEFYQPYNENFYRLVNKKFDWEK
jgi:hypothetical protein